MNDRRFAGPAPRPSSPLAFSFSSEPPPYGGGGYMPPPGGGGHVPPPGEAGYTPPPPGTPGGFEPPAGGEPPAAAPGLPWENRSQLGFMPALTQSVQGFASRPRQTFDSARRKGDYGSPLLWLLIFSVVAALVNWIWGLFFGGAITAFMSALMPERMRDDFAASLAESLGFRGVINLILYPCIALVGAFIGSAIYHLALVMSGGSGDPEAGFEGTFRAYSYSQVSQLAGIIPFIGGFISVIWGIVLFVIGMSSVHRLSTGKAVVVVLIPLFLCCACVSIALAFGLAGLIGMANR